jgi:TolB-like protein/Tfp pilus assembly protein PilF
MFSELKRRTVFRVAIAYLAAAWLVTEVAGTVLPAFGYGDSELRMIIVILAIALVPVLVFSWVFEFTTEGLKLEVDVDREQSITRYAGKKIDRLIVALLALALGYFAFDKFVMEPRRVAELVNETAQQARSEALVESYGDSSIAVLPFVNLSADPEQEYFSDGIAEELLNLLGQVPELRVISRSSAFRFKGKQVDIPSVAEQLKVANILEGSVRKAGNQIRIAAQLIEGRSDTQIWSETYELELTAPNLFDTQAHIAERIASALNTVLLEDDRERINRNPTGSLDAYEAYLMGRHRMATRAREDLEQAAVYFSRAVELDPKFTLAWVGLADANLLLVNYGAAPTDHAMDRAASALSHALSLDDQLGPAYTALGLSHSLRGDPIAAEGAYLRAVELDPSYATSYHWYADLLINSFGEAAMAIPLLEKARTLDPLSPIISVTLGEAFGWTGDVASSIRYYHRALEIEPDISAAYLLLSRAYLALGDDASAEYWINQGAGRVGNEPDILRARASLHLHRQEPAQAHEVALQLLAISPRDNALLYTLVSIGHYQEVIEKVASSFPELSCAFEPAISRTNVYQAMNLSLALQETGHRDCADRMLVRILDFMHEMPRQGRRSLGFLDGEIYARQGKTERALDAIEEGIEAGIRVTWCSQVKSSPHTVALRQNPRFDTVIKSIEADMSSQLAQVREMQAQGTLSPLPD